MKTNTTRSRAKSAMRRNGNTSNRPEENLAYQILFTYLHQLNTIDEQVKVIFNDVNYCILDIEFSIKSGQKYALRLQGPPHDEKKAIRHDRLQEYYLCEKGYIVIDFVYTQMPFLFLRNERVLVQEEVKEAWGEVSKQLKKYNLYLNPFNNNIDLQA